MDSFSRAEKPARLLYGTGMRLMECYSLRVKDIDFDRMEIIIRSGKEWAWFWVFPAKALSTDPVTKIIRRHHQHEKALQRTTRQAVRDSGISKPA
jgi:integrase